MAAKKKAAKTAAKTTAASASAPSAATKKATEKDAKTLSKIDKLAQAAVNTVKKGSNPALEIRTRSLSNVSFNEKKRIIELGDRTQSREFFNTNMARKFMQTFLVAEGCKRLIHENKTISIRQMFYMTKHTIRGTSENTFEDQNESDPIIEDLEVGIDALREELHLFANRRGLVVGAMVVKDGREESNSARRRSSSLRL
jgi:DNA topoisomerase-6 subunit A